MTEQVLESRKEGLLTITLNRPDRRNAMSPALTKELREAVTRAAVDADVRAVLIRGAGGTFSVGGDMQRAVEPKEELTYEALQVDLRSRTEVIKLLHEMPKPVVAMVQGAAAGAGLGLALACDIRIVGENAKITTAFAKVGLSGDFATAYHLTKIVGSAKARELFMLSPVLRGREAHELGMMTRVVPDADVEEVATTIATALANGPTVALGYIKKNINNAENHEFDVYFDAEIQFQARCAGTADHKDAAAAFLAKRPPIFIGR
jgi:2-(1,2-epoxy-1,2-dihydrophenyl)acetyl-CoA isomerase